MRRLRLSRLEAPDDHASARPTGPESRTQNLMLGALGVVFGDIGTSPLYTMQICMAETGDVTHSGVMGVLSLIVWALIIVVTLKYVVVVMRADNRGEGGILALTALALRGVKSGGRLAALVLAAAWPVLPCSTAMASSPRPSRCSRRSRA